VSIISTRALSPLPVLSAVEDLNELSPAELPYYTHMSGTSMAAPHVAGIVALMLEANPSLLPASVKDILQSTSTPMPGFEMWETGAGYVNAFDAVTRAFEMRTADAPQSEATVISHMQLTDFVSDQDELKTRIVAAYPNPFGADVTITYSLKDDGPVTVTLFDRFGHQVANVVNRVEQKGPHVVRLQKSDFNLGPGLYVARIKTAAHSQTIMLMATN
jgi:serine protease AprX